MSRIPVWVKLVPLYTVVSRNVSSCSLLSYVNLIVGCISLIFEMKCVSASCESFQIMKMSSM